MWYRLGQNIVRYKKTYLFFLLLTTIVMGLLGNWLMGSCAKDTEVIREVSIHKVDAIIIFLLNQ